MDNTGLVALLAEYFAAAGAPIACAYLFGSVARGEAGPNSDIDIAVLFSKPQPPRLIGPLSRTHADLERLTNRPVDLIDLHRASPDLIHRILRDSILLVERDRSARVAFEVQARNEYFDLLPYLLEYRRGGRP